MKRLQGLYQKTLIALAVLVLLGISIFTYQELFPSYKTFQSNYKDLEKFRSTLTGEKPAPYSMGIQQIVIPDAKNGPEIIDRCTSCHVAMKLPHFSPTRLAVDVNQRQIYDVDGRPALEANPDYIWKQLDEKIKFLKNEGNNREADKLEALKYVQMDGKTIDMRKALIMHPLIGNELRPFQYHPLEEYGCTSCHSGNGRALIAERAHGPVYDGEYEKAYEEKKPVFLESDPLNDPKFAYVYNDKPGHQLIFQTTPLLVGPLIQSRCTECHQSASKEMTESLDRIADITRSKEREIELLQKGMQHDQSALASLLELNQLWKEGGYETALQFLNQKLGDSQLSSEEIDAYEGQLSYLKKHQAFLPHKIEEDLIRILGEETLAKQALENPSSVPIFDLVKKTSLLSPSPFSYLTKEKHLKEAKETLAAMNFATESLAQAVQTPSVERKFETNVDRLIANYKRGQELFVSQACYACHRIAGFPRSSVGPELTKIGLSYPWYVKESIVWPQADLPSSTMPNFHLDHEEVQDLMTFLMAQRGDSKTISEVDYQISIKEWEAGKKLPFENPLPPTDILNLRKGMTIYATEGCASCHKLEGFKSDSGFTIEKNTNASLAEVMEEKEWFTRLFPEHIQGSKLANIVEEKALEIDQHLVDDVRQNSMLDEIEKRWPGLVASFYPNFRYASRARNTDYATEPQNLKAYQDRLHRILMMYVQVYGLGRDIAPHLNWSGVFRDQEWLMGHFHNPGAYTARSLMPVMPFDDTKFYALNHMLQVLGKENRDHLKAIWKIQGFNPPLAYQLLCSSCHGSQRQGNGLVSEWIYPIPKNLRNPTFLINLTQEKAIESITHGIKGTPMPPWGDAASKDEMGILSTGEIKQLVDWLYQAIPASSSNVEKAETRKWQYTPEDVIQEMQKQHEKLVPASSSPIDFNPNVNTYFEEKASLNSAERAFYIRKKFYTEENLKAGEEYFLVNCASCHGKDAAGTGLRATAMIEAKPRMLTNIPWIRSRDDMRLLRSIKYGVPGTSMIAWGDQTTAVQRMQLAMYIRHLSEGSVLRGELEDLLYEKFDASILLIEEARGNEFKHLESLENAHRENYQERQSLLVRDGSLSSEELKKASELYGNEIALRQEIESRRNIDQRYVDLIEEIRFEKKIYQDLGVGLIAKELSEDIVQDYFQLLKNYPLHYSFSGKKLEVNLAEQKSNAFQKASEKIVEFFEERIESMQRQLAFLKQGFQATKLSVELQKVLEEQGSLTNFKTRFIIQLANARKSREKQLQYSYSLKNL